MGKPVVPIHGDDHRPIGWNGPTDPGGPDPLTWLEQAEDIHTLLFVVSSTATITTGVKGDVQLHRAYTIKSWTLMATSSGSIQIDIWKDVYANFPPTNADSICGSDEPFISSDDSNTALIGATNGMWTGTSLLAGDVLRFNVDSVTSISRVTLALELEAA